MEKQTSKTVIYLISLTLCLLVIGSVLFFRNSNTIQSSSIQKIESIISEIGDLKQQNQILNEKVQAQSDENQLNQATIKQLYLNISTQTSKVQNLTDYQQTIETEKTQLKNQTNNLTNQLNQKNQEISDLKQKQQNDKQLDSLNKQLYTILFLGTNRNLTDSIQLAVINPQKQKTTLISLPRDLYIDGRKINEYYEFYGSEKTTEVIKKITGLKINKFVSFNFQAFTELIDSIGGIDIQVDKQIIDKQYPTDDFSYQTVIFQPGLEKMNGERALQYARSRKSTSDFDRSNRQQKIIIALKEKLQSLGLIKNIEFYISAFHKIQNNLKTDFTILEGLQSFDQYKNYQISAGNILSNENFLYSSRSLTGQAILLPKKGNFNEFQSNLIEII